MIEEVDLICTLMVSYFMQKHTEDDGTMSDDSGRISDARDLARLVLLSAFQSERESVFEMEAMMTSL